MINRVTSVRTMMNNVKKSVKKCKRLKRENNSPVNHLNDPTRMAENLRDTSLEQSRKAEASVEI